MCSCPDSNAAGCHWHWACALPPLLRSAGWLGRQAGGAAAAPGSPHTEPRRRSNAGARSDQILKRVLSQLRSSLGHHGSAVDQTKRLYRCSAVIHFSGKGRSIRSSQRALGELRRKELREIQSLCVSEPRERRSPWRGSPEGARRGQETRRRRRGVRLRGQRS